MYYFYIGTVFKKNVILYIYIFKNHKFSKSHFDNCDDIVDKYRMLND